MSGDVRKIKKDKEIVVELESQIRDISLQFGDQLKSLDHRLDTFHGVVWEMQDYYRRQAEVQSEYSKNLEKMSRQINVRHKDNKQKRESWAGYSTFQAWQGLVLNTKQTSKDQAAISEILNTLSVRLGEVGEDMQRIYKKCRDVTIQCQADISKVLSDVLNAMKTYHLYHGESQVAENKLLRVQSQKVKVDQQSGGLARKFVNYEKKSEKKQAKYVENKLKALKARNEYLLCIDIANAAVQKYFGEDFPRMVRKMDAGYHFMVSQVLEIHANSQRIVNERDRDRASELFKRAQEVQGSSDYDLFFGQSQKIFQLPNKIEFQSHKGDEVTQICAQKSVLDDILVRLDQIGIRLNKEKENKVESTKIYESNEKQFFDKLRCSPINLDQYFIDDKSVVSKSPTDKMREDKVRLEDLFVEMYKDNLLRDNLIIRLQTKYDSLRKSLGDNVCEHIPINISHRVGLKKRPPSLPPKPKKRNAEFKPGKEGTRPKLFGGSIEEYVEATGEAIPSIMRSCIRVINIYGMLHQGIFRVSGSMNEMTNYKQMFERGEDPLQDKMDGDDINTVAGLLKMYFRELKEPLFPSQHFDALINCCEAMYPSTTSEGDKDWKCMLKDILATLSPQRIVIMRYLFAFLSHVTEYSDENMMEAFNLSICFGPTLIIPSADRTDQHQYQGLINDLVKNIIAHYQDIFPPPTHEDYDNNAVYEKFLIDKDFLVSMSDDDGLKGAVNEEDEDFEEREATVDENYEARGEGELSCCRGDVVTLLRRESNDFWTVELQNRIGLLPDRILDMRSRSLHSSLKKTHNLNRSLECLTSNEFINQSNASLVKTPSNHNVSENGSSAATPAQTNKTYRSSNISLHSIAKNSAVSDHASVSAGLDSILAKVQIDINSFGPQQQHVTMATTRYQQTLVPVLPPLPRPTISGEPQPPPLKISTASYKKRNVSLGSELDVVVTPPSPSLDKSFPAPPILSHDPASGKLSSPLIGQNKSSTTIKWNSLPHNIPAVGNNSAVPVSMHTVLTTSTPVVQPSIANNRIHSASPSLGTPSSSHSAHPSTQSTTIQSATLPRSSDKQSSAPPMVRAKPTLPKKRISGTQEDRNSITPENIPKVTLAPTAQHHAPSLPLNTFGRPIKPAESTFLSSLDSNGERNQFSSFKISSNPKKQ